MIKLSDLKAARSKMEPGPYTHEPCEPPAGAVDIRGSRCTCLTLPVGTSLGRLHLLEVFDVYDGPRTFSVQSSTGVHYLAFWAGQRIDADAWLYVPTSSARLDAIAAGRVALRDAFTEPEDGFVYLVGTGATGDRARPLISSEIDPEMLPIVGDRLSGERMGGMCPQHEHIAEWVPLDTAIGIEATHAAADILIEIAVAALAWRKAEQHRDEALSLMNAAQNSDDYSAAATLLPPLGRDRDASLSRLTAALSKVQP